MATASLSEPVTMGTTASALARAFGIVVRQIADLLALLQDYNGTAAPALSLPRTLEVSYQESINLQLLIEYQMKGNWDWLMTVMDSTEAQLRFGSALSNLATESGLLQSSLYPGGGGQRTRQTGHDRAGMPTRSGSGSAGDQLANRREFLNYALSLMRAHNAEHSDSLPVLDVAAMKHIAYVFDALIYYMRSGTDAAAAAAADGGEDTPKGDPYEVASYGGLGYDENDNDDDDVAEELSAAHANAAAAAAAAASRNQQVGMGIFAGL